MATKDKKLTHRPRIMYMTNLEQYKNRLNVIKRKDGYDNEKKLLKVMIDSTEGIITHDDSVPVNKNGFSIN